MSPQAIDEQPAAPSASPAASRALRAVAQALRAHAMELPGAYEDHPWGEVVAKVKGKVFVFFGREADLDEHIGLSVKLPRSGEALLAMSFATPTGYGLGRAGWVSIHATAADALPLELLTSWVEESYRAVAPKKLVAQLPAE